MRQGKCGSQYGLGEKISISEQDRTCLLQLLKLQLEEICELCNSDKKDNVALESVSRRRDGGVE